jgi:hypothetical protein
MFANTAPFKHAIRVNKARAFQDAQDKLYKELTERFQLDSSDIQGALEDAIRHAKSPRDYRTAIWTYNRVVWNRSYATAREMFSTQEEFEDNYRELKREVLAWGHETLVNDIPTHKLVDPRFRNRLGAFFGDHFVVTTRTTQNVVWNGDYSALQETLYLEYWDKEIPITARKLREPPEEETPPSPINTSIPLYRLEGDTVVCYYHNNGE